jgi:hypothetical protein
MATTKMTTTINQDGDNVTMLDTGAEGIKVWNHQHGVHIGTAGDEENARQMIDG